MKLKFGLTAVSVGLAALLGGVLILACGEEAPGNNGPSEEYYPSTAGDVWTYDLINRDTDPTGLHPIYARVSINNLVRIPGAPPTPTLVTSYAKNDEDKALQLEQAFYWKDQDLFFRYDYYAYASEWYQVSGYYYLSQYHDPIVGTYYYNQSGRVAFSLFKTPLQVNDKWDVLNIHNQDPENNPTIFRNVDQKDYFGLARDMDRDGLIDSMDISITGKVEKRELLDTAIGEFNCYKVVLTQRLTFHLTGDDDVEDVSKTTYWIAENWGILKQVSNEDSQYLDELEMNVKNVWFVK